MQQQLNTSFDDVAAEVGRIMEKYAEDVRHRRVQIGMAEARLEVRRAALAEMEKQRDAEVNQYPEISYQRAKARGKWLVTINQQKGKIHEAEVELRNLKGGVTESVVNSIINSMQK